MAIKLNMTKETREAVTELAARGLDRHIVTVVPDRTSVESRSLMETALARVAEGRSLTPEDIAAYNDACNRKYLANLGEEVRSAKRDSGNGGSAADPQCSLREEDENDEDGEIDPEKACSRSGHERAAQFHRNQALYAKSLGACSRLHNAANLHAEASRLYPYGPSDDARAASRKLKG